MSKTSNDPTLATPGRRPPSGLHGRAFHLARLNQAVRGGAAHGILTRRLYLVLFELPRDLQVRLAISTAERSSLGAAARATLAEALPDGAPAVTVTSACADVVLDAITTAWRDAWARADPAGVRAEREISRLADEGLPTAGFDWSRVRNPFRIPEVRDAHREAWLSVTAMLHDWHVDRYHLVEDRATLAWAVRQVRRGSRVMGSRTSPSERQLAASFAENDARSVSFNLTHELPSPDDDPAVINKLPRSARIGRLRQIVDGGAPLRMTMIEVVAILWGLPGLLQIQWMAGVLGDALADWGGDVDWTAHLLQAAREIRALAEIPGEERVVHEALCDSVPDSDAPALRSLSSSLWALLEATDERAFSEVVTSRVVESFQHLRFAVIERGVEQGARAAVFDRFHLRAVASLEAAGFSEYPASEGLPRTSWPLDWRPEGRCCGTVERHERALLADASREVRRLLLERAVRLEPGCSTNRDHLTCVFLSEPPRVAFAIAGALVRRAASLVPRHHTDLVEKVLVCAEALSAAEGASPLGTALLDGITAREAPSDDDAGGPPFHRAVRALAEAAHSPSDPARTATQLAHAVHDSILSREDARLALESPERWTTTLSARRDSQSADRNRRDAAVSWLVTASPPDVVRDEREASWALVLGLLRESAAQPVTGPGN